jgi:ankyrin repeat protein
LQICAIDDSSEVAAVLIEASAQIDALCDPPNTEQEEDEEGIGQADMSVDAESEGAKKAGQEERSEHVLGLRTALHLAALHNSPEVAQLLLEAKADVSACLSNVEGAVTPLHECAASDAAETARVLAAAAAAATTAAAAGERVQEKEMDVDAAGETGTEATDEPKRPCWCSFPDPLHATAGPTGSTPLHAAAENDAPGVARALLRSKARIDARDDQGDTPLHCAAMYSSPQTLEVLLEGNSDLLCENSSGELPLHLMAEYGPGVDSDMPPALVARHFARSIKAQKAMMEALVGRGQLAQALSHAASGDNGNTPLHGVARWDHYGAEHAVKLLCNARADLEAKNTDGQTAYAMAVRRYGREGRVAKLLRDLGAQEGAAAGMDALAHALGGCVRPIFPLVPGDAAGPVLPLQPSQQASQAMQ